MVTTGRIHHMVALLAMDIEGCHTNRSHLTDLTR